MINLRRRLGLTPRLANSPLKRKKRLLLELLEDRKLLAGVINVDISALGTIKFLGDGDDNAVVVRRTEVPNTYFITRPAGDETLFQLNGAGVTMQSLTVNGINGNIFSELGDGNDTFSFLGQSTGVISDIPANLIITNGDGSDVNTIEEVFIHGDLRVAKAPGASGRSELTIVKSTVIGDTIVDNTGSGLLVGNTGGSTKTIIDTSVLQGDGHFKAALILRNGDSSDIVDVRGNSQFGTGAFIVAATPVVRIDNGAGGSRVTFTGSSNVAGPGTTTIYGDVDIDNAFNIQGTSDIVTFNKVNVLGDVDVNNGDGTTQMFVLESNLGSYQATSLAGKLSVQNGSGYDELKVIGSQLPYGLYVSNGIGAQNWGSSTQITNSKIGEMLGNNDTSLEIIGDNGNDTVNVQATVFRGLVDLDSLRNGTNEVQITNQSILPKLRFIGGDENDRIILNDSSVLYSVEIRLNAGADVLQIINIDPATEWPSALLGTVILDGGLGVDSINASPLTAGSLSFELITTT